MKMINQTRGETIKPSLETLYGLITQNIRKRSNVNSAEIRICVSLLFTILTSKK